MAGMVYVYNMPISVNERTSARELLKYILYCILSYYYRAGIDRLERLSSNRKLLSARAV